jgi:hypothetical protein
MTNATANHETASSLKSFFFEVYTKDQNGQPGTGISVGFAVDCRDQDDAKGKIKSRFGRRFDCFIDVYEAPISPLNCKTVIVR